MDRNRFPLRLEYLDVDGNRKVTAPFYDQRMLPAMVIGLRAAGATEFRMFHDGAQTPHPCVSYSKYPGHGLSTRKWNGGL